jgi:nitroreductase
MTDPGRSAIDLALFEVLATSRRTSLKVDREATVPVELVQRLCRLATWAPNHKKTWPWRFALFTGEGRAELGATIADALEASGLDDAKRLEKFRVKYLRAPAMLVVGSTAGEFDLRTVENRDAVAAGVENLLLGATAAGLASFWSSGVPEADAAVATLAGWEEGTSTVAIVYLGWPDGAVATPERPLPDLVVVDDRR